MKKLQYTTIVLVVACVLLFVVASMLLFDYSLAKRFSDLCENIEKFDSCKVVCIMVDREDEISLSGDALDALIFQLEQLKYFKRGHYSTMEGTIYHIYFSSPRVDPFEIVVSDLGKVYIGSNYYEFSPDVNNEVISSYIENLFES